MENFPSWLARIETRKAALRRLGILYATALTTQAEVSH